ncbi:hypothetical protein NP493_66g06013 [Ridgeia piscesae]|uniref:Uncharacterized protein n=1 Tax=Ridgeia piscesae TaxID=27915 RepID=A0AAD9UIS3_RIDPI|nr:hypothetical protein NP493_66g06013 [Ridgeia piscesae]
MPDCLRCDGRGGLTEDNFLLVSDYSIDTLRQLNLANDSAIRIPIRHQYVRSPVYDPVEKTVYWFYDNYIKRAYINGTQENLVWRQEYDRWGSSIRAIAIDPVSRLLYYTGTMYGLELGSNFLASMTLDGRHHFLLVTSRTNSIDNIALDPVTGTMYWSVGQGIDMAAMDGSQHHRLVNSDRYIYGLTIDAEGQCVYWCDGRRIESVAYDGNNRRLLAERQTTLAKTTTEAVNTSASQRPTELNAHVLVDSVK